MCTYSYVRCTALFVSLALTSSSNTGLPTERSLALTSSSSTGLTSTGYSATSYSATSYPATSPCSNHSRSGMTLPSRMTSTGYYLTNYPATIPCSSHSMPRLPPAPGSVPSELPVANGEQQPLPRRLWHGSKDGLCGSASGYPC